MASANYPSGSITSFLENRVTSWVKSKFPHTPQITTQELEDKLESCDGSIIVIDCRSSGEHQVSKIRGAQHLNFNADEDIINEFLVENGVESDKNVVCYCSIGYRSSILANRINAIGAGNASNLEGSMFKWANEGREIVDFGGNTTHFVHPYNWFFGLTISPSKWLYEPRHVTR